MNRRTIVFMVLGFLALAGALGALIQAGGNRASTTATSATGPAPGSRSIAGGAAVGVAEPAASPVAPSFAGDGPFDVTSLVGQVGPKIVKQGRLTLQVRKGTFADRFQQAMGVARAHGGFVEDSHTTVGRFRSGSMTIRVPVSEFEAAFAELKPLGIVKGEEVSGQDVTAQFVDLQARLKNWQAQETVLLRLMSKATTVVDSIRVQNQLQQVQQNIEELQGELRLLSDQTAMGTITLSMTEQGLVSPPITRSTLTKAWHDALHGFVIVFAAVLVGLGYLIPLSLVVLAGLLGWLGVRRVRRQTVTVP